MAGEGKLAGNVRARLEDTEEEKGKEKPFLVVDNSSMNSKDDQKNKALFMREIDELDKLSFGKPIRVHVQEFACVFAIIAFGVSSYLLYKYNDLTTTTILCGIGALLIVLGYRAPRVLLPLWKGWMGLAHILGTVVTFVILSLMWTAVALPIALLLKLIGKHVMDLRYDPSIKTYWDDREEKYHDFKLLERQF